MYILAKRIEGEDSFTIHGVSESDKVWEAWHAGGGSIFNLDPDDLITFLPRDPEVFGDDEPEEAE